MKSLPGIQFDFILICKDIWTVFCWCFIPLFSRMCRMRTTHERNRSERKLFTVCFHIAMVVAGMEFVDLALCCRCICRRLCDISTRHTQTYSHHLVNTLLPKPPMDIYIYWWKLMNWLQSSIDNDIESPAHASMQSKPMIKKKTEPTEVSPSTNRYCFNDLWTHKVCRNFDICKPAASTNFIHHHFISG